MEDMERASFMLHPLSRVALHWTWFKLALVLYNVSMLPWNVAFTIENSSKSCQNAEVPASNCYPPLFDGLDQFVTALLLLNMVIEVRTGYIKDRAVADMCPSRAWKRYAKTWLLCDLVSILPLSKLYGALYPDKEEVARYLKGFWLLRLTHVTRHKEKLAGSTALVQLAKQMLLFLLMSHWVGCAFWFLSRWQVEHLDGFGRNAETGFWPWILVDYRLVMRTHSEEEQQGPNMTYCGTSLERMPPAFHSRLVETLYCADMRTKYTSSIFWGITTMTTTGYGNIVPSTNIERNFVMLVELIGAVSTALIFGNMAVLMQKRQLSKVGLQEKLDHLNDFFRFQGIPRDMANRIRSNMEYLWSVHHGMDVDHVLAELPGSLRAEVLLHIQASVVKTAPPFRFCDQPFIKAVVVRMRPQVFLPDEIIIREGDAGNEMYFIQHGVVQVLSLKTGEVHAELGHGDCFGEVEPFTVKRRLESVQALTHVHVYFISRQSFDEVVTEFPDHVKRMEVAGNNGLVEGGFADLLSAEMGGQGAEGGDLFNGRISANGSYAKEGASEVEQADLQGVVHRLDRLVTSATSALLFLGSEEAKESEAQTPRQF